MIFRGIATLDFDFQRDCITRFWFSKGWQDSILIFKGIATIYLDFQMNCNIHFFWKVIARFWKGIATLDFKGAGHVYPNLKINVESTLNVECNPFVPAAHIKFVWMNIVCGNIQKAEILGYWIFGQKKLRNRKLSLNHKGLFINDVINFGGYRDLVIIRHFLATPPSSRAELATKHRMLGSWP